VSKGPAVYQSSNNKRKMYNSSPRKKLNTNNNNNAVINKNWNKAGGNGMKKKLQSSPDHIARTIGDNAKKKVKKYFYCTQKSHYPIKFKTIIATCQSITTILFIVKFLKTCDWNENQCRNSFERR
jgi:hypothetical protein